MKIFSDLKFIFNNDNFRLSWRNFKVFEVAVLFFFNEMKAFQNTYNDKLLQRMVQQHCSDR